MPDLADRLGAWEGTWLTFLVSDELHDESPVSATIADEDGVLVIDYEGSIRGQGVTGRLRWHESAETTSVDWVDSWHTQGTPQRLIGVGGEPPSYQYGDDDPWTWDITIDASASGVTVTHHNSGPGISRYVGVVMNLDTRTSDEPGRG